ncbi:unnamed protein product [Leptidea sinapis]|uniref:Uncharacterized protein n=1 Tax=Leptidea sinapis TaxID=189913 RepID=A0A5E4PMD7_9NEOP|nr:unnamed protein product [Leptidea sinapis]
MKIVKQPFSDNHQLPDDAALISGYHPASREPLLQAVARSRSNRVDSLMTLEIKSRNLYGNECAYIIYVHTYVPMAVIAENWNDKSTAPYLALLQDVDLPNKKTDCNKF